MGRASGLSSSLGRYTRFYLFRTLAGALFGAAIGKPLHKAWQVGVVVALSFLLASVTRVHVAMLLIGIFS